MGEPVVATREHKVTIAAKPGQDYGILITSEASGFLILRMKADRPKA